MLKAIHVELTRLEMAFCKVVAKSRHHNNRLKGVRNAKIGGQSDWQTDLEGFGAEVGAV